MSTVPRASGDVGAPERPEAAPRAASARPARRREQLRATLADNPLLTDADLAGLLGVSVQTVRLDRLATGIPEHRDRVRAVAERSLREPAAAGRRRLRSEVVDLQPGVSAVALLGAAGGRGGERPGRLPDPALFAGAETLALAASGLRPAAVAVVNVKFRREPAAPGRLVAKAEVLRGRGGARGRQRRVVLVQIRAGGQTVFRAKFAVVAAGTPPA